MRRIISIMVVSVVVVLLAGLAGGAVSVSAESLSPWFHLASVSRPGSLQSGGAKSEVQEVVVKATGGEFVLSEPVATEKEEFFNGKGEPEFVVLPDDATARQVEEGLEGFYGAGNVEVTGGPGDATGSKPYVVMFTGALASRPVELIGTRWSELFGDTSQGQLRVTEQAHGQADGVIAVTAINLGDGVADGEASPVRIVDRLPGGLRALFVEGNTRHNGSAEYGPVDCALRSSQMVECSFAGALLPPYAQVEVVIGVGVGPGAVSGELNEASASGGGAPAAGVKHPITVAKEPGEVTPFGVENYEQSFEEVGGTSDAQAGSHPFQFTTTLDLNQTSEGEPAGALAKDLSFRLPAGLVGNPTAYPRCTLAQFTTIVNAQANQCPANTVIGVAVVSFLENEEGLKREETSTSPIFNLEPSVGEPARFGFQPAGIPVFLDTFVRTGEDYGITTHVENIPQLVGFLANTVTFWGVPGDPRHDDVRGSGCLAEIDGESEEERHLHGVPPCIRLEESNPPPFLGLPTSCTGPLQDSVQADSWAEPHNVLSFPSAPRQAPLEGVMLGLDGCGSLAFGSEIKVSPDVEAGSTPSGLKVDVHVPQEEALDANGLAPSDVRNITVALPEGVALNPAAADGLQACTQAQVGLSDGNESLCPDASKIATATITTPLLPDPLKGFVYLASPQNFASPPNPLENPFGSLVAMYLVARDPVSGVIVKLAGSVSLSPTGQITATFADNPQLPFEDAEIGFFGGDRAPLATPALCRRPGEEGYRTSASFEPWSNTETIHEALQSVSEFNITSGPHGAPCPNPPGVQSPATLPFAPSLRLRPRTSTRDPSRRCQRRFPVKMASRASSPCSCTIRRAYPGLLSGVKLCRESASERRNMWSGKPDRGNDRQRRPRR